MSSARTSSVRAALGGLTTRGRCFLAAGLACALVAFALGQRDVLRVAVLLAALPLAAAWVVSRSRYRLSCTRRLDPARVTAGLPSSVSLRLDNVSRLATGLLLVEDRVPYVLGSRPRFVLDRVEPHGSCDVVYTVRSDVRGRYSLGPLSVRLTDPFGMCELQRGFTATDMLTVAPAVVELSSLPLGGQRGGSGESSARALAAAGEDDVATREYRHGDPLHRVHWRSTARRGELMVRREEQPWQSRATVVLDIRSDAHRGEGPGSSFEMAVSAAASVAVHLVRRGYLVRLVTSDGAEIGGNESVLGGDTEGLLLDALAVVEPAAGRNDREGGLGALASTVRRAREGVVILILGAPVGGASGQSPDAHVLAGVAPYVRSGVAVLLDTASWSPSSGSPSPGSTRSARQGRDGAEDRASGSATVAAVLANANWRVVPLGAGGSLAAAWEGVMTGGTSTGATKAREAVS